LQPPTPHPFLGADAGAATADADALILGLAADGGVSFRPGAVQAPSEIRAFSDSIETYSPRAERDLDDLRLVDLGDHDDRTTVESVVAGVLDVAWAGVRKPLLMSIGGDHSVTPPAVRAVAARMPELAVVGFDAHLDLREDYEGDHACTYRRIEDAGIRCFVFGVRSGARSEWEDVPKVLAFATDGLVMPPEVRRYLEGRPVYVTLDIDVLDPSCAPGTGNPEAGGPSFGALLAAIEALQGLDVVACDLVEVSPPLDGSGITLGAAALLVREMILRFTSEGVGAEGVDGGR
jgi:agmatinase